MLKVHKVTVDRFMVDNREFKTLEEANTYTEQGYIKELLDNVCEDSNIPNSGEPSLINILDILISQGMVSKTKLKSLRNKLQSNRKAPQKCE